MGEQNTEQNSGSDEGQSNTSSQAESAPPQNNEPKRLKVLDLLKAIWAGYNSDNEESEKAKTFAKRVISQYLQQVNKDQMCKNDYNVLILYDNNRLVRSDADKIYNAITKFKDNKPILLILFSGGGLASSAFLIAKLCRQYSDGNFSISVPRYAKSAATIIACAANRIHMGSLSELGPIDPQIDNLPALGLKNSVEHIAELTKKYPESSDMFAKYLNLSLNLINIGYYERVAESAWQYAERLLETHSGSLPRSAKDIAFDLVYKYKDHSFVIDKDEAAQIFGEKIVVYNTEEYELGNAIYKALEMIRDFFKNLDCEFYYIGSLFSEPTIQKNA